MTCRKNKIQQMIAGSLVLVICMLAASLLLAQKASSNVSGKKTSTYSELAKVPPNAGARLNPLQGDRAAVAAGGKLFARHCAQCHGDLAQGTRRAPTLLAGSVGRATPGTVFWILTNGVVRRGMPVWSKLPEPQRWQIVSYLKFLTADGMNQPR